jgi:DNA-binding response OmpR family regulator
MVLLVSADAASLQARQEQLAEYGFATRTATDVDELQSAFNKQEQHKVDIVVVGAALPSKEKLRITTILRDEAKRIPIVLLADSDEAVVDSPDAVLRTSASADEFVDVVRKCSKSRRRNSSAAD